MFDEYWRDGWGGGGENQLGELLMQLRKHFTQSARRTCGAGMWHPCDNHLKTCYSHKLYDSHVEQCDILITKPLHIQKSHAVYIDTYTVLRIHPLQYICMHLSSQFWAHAWQRHLCLKCAWQVSEVMCPLHTSHPIRLKYMPWSMCGILAANRHAAVSSYCWVKRSTSCWQTMYGFLKYLQWQFSCSCYQH